MSLMVHGEYQRSDSEICQSVGMCFREAAGAMLLPASQTFKMPPAFYTGHADNNWTCTPLALYGGRFVSSPAAASVTTRNDAVSC
jgi:hypothetical protein